jgi:sulfite exporter TauE/SafE
MTLTGTTGLELSTFLLVGLLGEVHCLAMCGPLVHLYSSKMETSKAVSWYELRQHSLYHLGRISSYFALGALFGSIGWLFQSLSRSVGLFNYLTGGIGLAVGLIIMVSGFRQLLTGSSGGWLESLGGQLGTSLHQRLDTTLQNLTNGPGIVSLGAIHSLLPCPILYPAYLYVLARGRPLFGAVAMGLIGLGSVPLLFVQGLFHNSVDGMTSPLVQRGLGLLVLVLGIFLFGMALSRFGFSSPLPMPPFFAPLS